MRLFKTKYKRISKRVSLFLFLSFISLSLLGQKANSFTQSLKGEKEYYLKIKYPGELRIGELSRFVSFDAYRNDSIFMYCREANMGSLEKQGIKPDFAPHPGKRLTEGQAVKGGLDYPSYGEYVNRMQAFEANYPNLCQLDTIADLASGHQLLVLQLCSNLEGADSLPEVLLTSTMHGDETVGYVLLLEMIDSLLSGYSVNPFITNLLDSLSIWINPNANPDGTYAGGDNNVNSATRGNANLVDLNRNYPTVNGLVNDPPEEETQAMLDFAVQRDFTLATMIHGGAEVVNYPWDTWSRLHPDDDWWQYIGHLYADSAQHYGPLSYFNGFNDGITNGYAWYPVVGGRQDYMNFHHDCREFTLEISDSKNPNASTLDTYWKANQNSLFHLCDQAKYGIHGYVLDATDYKVLHARLSMENHDRDSTDIRTQMPVGDFHRPLGAGQYRMVVEVEDYYTQYIDFSISNNQRIDTIIYMQKILPLALEDVRIYPNPADGKLFIDRYTQALSIELFDINGRHITHVHLQPYQTEYDVQFLASGVYFLKLNSQEKSIIRKLIIQ